MNTVIFEYSPSTKLSSLNMNYEQSDKEVFKGIYSKEKMLLANSTLTKV